MSELNEQLIRSLIAKAGVPLVFRNFVEKWPLCQWNLEKWCAAFGDREIPFRCMKKNLIGDEPCWERRCNEKKMTFKTFVDNQSTSDEWMYFDYKYLHQWFSADDELCKNVCWKQFGYGGKGAADSTLWVGSCGAHTPCHQDTYGVNVVAQLYGKPRLHAPSYLQACLYKPVCAGMRVRLDGKTLDGMPAQTGLYRHARRKRWILFPPETGGLKPTRVPYEESSVYSEINFYCPASFEVFNGLTGGRTVELSAGDALFVPRGWWHYVQNVDPINIALNVWIPHEKDASVQVSEALIKIFVAQICKDLPEETAKLIVNPNEDDLADTPLAVLFLQLETVANTYLDSRRKARRAKRLKTSEDDPTAPLLEEFVLKDLLENNDNNLELAQSITSEDIINILKGNIRVFATQPPDDDEVDGITSRLDLTKAVIDSFSQSNVIELVKQNLLARMGSS